MITASRKIAASCACGDIVTSTVLARKTNRRGKVKVTCFGCIGIERLHNASLEWIKKTITRNYMSRVNPNTVQKKWMTDITEWANNSGLRLLYGDEWEFDLMQRHHVLGRTARHNKVYIGHEFIIPVPFSLHDVSSNHPLNVTYHKHSFTDEFGLQSELFIKMYHSMQEEGYTVPSEDVFNAIMDTNA